MTKKLIASTAAIMVLTGSIAFAADNTVNTAPATQNGYACPYTSNHQQHGQHMNHMNGTSNTACPYRGQHMNHMTGTTQDNSGSKVVGSSTGQSGYHNGYHNGYGGHNGSGSHGGGHGGGHM